MSLPSRPLRALGPTLAIALVTVAAGCGGAADSSSTAEQRPTRTVISPTTSDKVAAPKVDEREQLAAVVEQMYSDLSAGNAAGVCAAMSAQAQAQIAQQVPGGSTQPPAKRTCLDSLDRFLDLASRSGLLERTRQASVGAIRIDGDSATARVSFGGPAGDVRLTRERGNWRFGSDALAPN